MGFLKKFFLHGKEADGRTVPCRNAKKQGDLAPCSYFMWPLFSSFILFPRSWISPHLHIVAQLCTKEFCFGLVLTFCTEMNFMEQQKPSLLPSEVQKGLLSLSESSLPWIKCLWNCPLKFVLTTHYPSPHEQWLLQSSTEGNLWFKINYLGYTHVAAICWLF